MGGAPRRHGVARSLVGVGEAGVSHSRRYWEELAGGGGLVEVVVIGELAAPGAPAGMPFLGRFLSELRAKTVLR